MAETDRHFVKSASGTPVDDHQRRRDFLTPDEMGVVLKAANAGRHRVRDHLLILLAYRHGLRVSELISLRQDDLDLATARLWVRRLKHGLATHHPLAGDELRAVRRYLALRSDQLPYLFLSERNGPLSRQAVNYLVAKIGARAGFKKLHPHMLRHACGFALANRGHDLRLIQDFLGHRDPRHTARYTRTAASRFLGLW